MTHPGLEPSPHSVSGECHVQYANRASQARTTSGTCIPDLTLCCAGKFEFPSLHFNNQILQTDKYFILCVAAHFGAIYPYESVCLSMNFEQHIHFEHNQQKIDKK